jgi:hypothetical protein
VADVWMPFSGTKGGGVAVRLQAHERTAIRGLTSEYRGLLTHESQASDSAVARLFPPAYREDPLRNFDYERQTHDDLMAERLAAIGAVEGNADATTLTAGQAHTWLGVLNDLRLVLGTRLEITEDSSREDFDAEPASANTFALYQWLTHLVGALIEALDPSLTDLGSEGPPPEDPTG